MKNQLAKLRAVADFAEQHDLVDHLSAVNVYLDCKVQVFGDGTDIGALIPWAEALGETVVWIKEVEPNFHLYVRGELPGVDGKFTVVAVTGPAESQAIVDASMYRRTELPVALAVMRTLIRSGKDGAR